ncbi:MAG: hypothetical protein JRK53_00515 [Deltaproteobacteria bacterium]|nr:hypothetical protein [Deltaproteobacteria bacterium]MBW1816022.1 hypothetical protein [Deltaproteobacteria bacterium]MBW2282979.1 hypothetical protein [Deltaproteobacteria bacterium]
MKSTRHFPYFPDNRALRGLTIPLAVILLVVLTATAIAGDGQAAPEPTLSAAFDRESAPVGSTVTLTLAYSLPEKAAVSTESAVKGLEELAVLDARFQPGRIQFDIMIDRIGSLSTGPLSLAYLDAEGERKALDAAPASVTVLSNLGEKPQEAGLRPIRGIVPTRSRWLAYWPWALGAAGLLIVAAVLFGGYRRFIKKDRIGTPQDSPHIRAEKALEALEAQGLFEKGAVKTHYFRLSEILRQYLEALRGFPAAEYTTEEIARRVSAPEDLNLVPLLRGIDLVKFADALPTRARKDETHHAALAYVRETAPSPVNGGLSSREAAS